MSYSRAHSSWGLSRECRILSRAFTSAPSSLPLWTDVDPSCECRWEVFLSLSGAADWILSETSSPSSQLEWLPRAPLRSSRNQLPVSHLVKLVSRCLHFHRRKQELDEGLGVCQTQSAESVINNVVYQWIGLFFGDGAMQRMSSVRPCVTMRETNIQRDQNIWGQGQDS